MRLPPPAIVDHAADLPAGAFGASADPLHGSWAAVRWEYESRDGARSVDLIAEVGAAVTLSMSAGDYVLSYARRTEPGRTTAGALRVVDDAWIEFSPRIGATERVSFRRSAGTLVLRNEASGWDFTGAGEESASFHAVLVRL
jgi:hypothetical protein